MWKRTHKRRAWDWTASGRGRNGGEERGKVAGGRGGADRTYHQSTCNLVFLLSLLHLFGQKGWGGVWGALPISWSCQHSLCHQGNLALVSISWVCCGVLKCDVEYVAVCCRVLQCDAKCVAVCCSVCCSVLMTRGAAGAASRPCVLYVRDRTHLCVWRDSFTWILTGDCLKEWHLLVWNDWLICITWLFHVCDMTHLRVWRDSLTWIVTENYLKDWHLLTVTPIFEFMRHVTRMNKSRHAWVMSHAWMSHVTHMNQSHHTNGRGIAWKNDICSCDMTYSYAWHDSFICVTWLIYVCDMYH